MRHLLNQSITIFEISTKPDRDGKIVWNKACSTKSRFVRINKQFADQNGKVHELTASFVIANHEIKIGQKILHNDKEYQVVSVTDWVNGVGEIYGFYCMCENYKANG
jgi:hypothetical protein